MASAEACARVPTTDRLLPIADPISRQQVETLRTNCREFGITEYSMGDIRQGIVSVLAGDVWRADNPFQDMLLNARRGATPGTGS